MRRILLPALLALAACADDAATANAASGAAKAGTLVEVPTAEALVDDLATVGAETVVLNFWATWCGPCIAEFPMFVDFSREVDDVAVRFVSVDATRDIDAVNEFLAEHGVSEPSYLYTGPGDLPSQLNPLFGGGAIPVTMILDGDGIVEHTHVGAMSRPELDRLVAQAQEGRS